jgi:Xaa-Pro aminopeptidase
MYPHQLDRLGGALERAGVDALVATSSANVAYVTGFHSFSRAFDPWVEVAAVFAGSRTALIVPGGDVAAVEAAGLEIDHVVSYSPSSAETADVPGTAVTFIDAVVTAIDALGSRPATIGIDESGLGADGLPNLTARLAPSVTVRAAAPLGWARSVKGPYEIECLQRALGIAEEAVNVVLQTLKPGVTEREAVVAFDTEVLKRGAALAPSTVAFGAGTAQPAGWASDRPLRMRDLVRFDLGCIYKGYHAVLVRTAVMGLPDHRQEVAHSALLAGVEGAIDVIKPGVSPGAVLQAGLVAVRSSGLERYTLSHMGHGIGLDVTEPPEISHEVGGSLEAGMVVRVEAPYQQPGWAGLGITETVLVTQGGAHSLNRSHRGLIVLD